MDSDEVTDNGFDDHSEKTHHHQREEDVEVVGSDSSDEIEELEEEEEDISISLHLHHHINHPHYTGFTQEEEKEVVVIDQLSAGHGNREKRKFVFNKDFVENDTESDFAEEESESDSEEESPPASSHLHQCRGAD